MCTCVCWGACRLYCYAHYTSCFQQFHLINNKCTIITASPPALPVFCQLPPGQPPWTLWPPPSSRADSYEAEGTWADGGGQTPNVRGNTHLSGLMSSASMQKVISLRSHSALSPNPQYSLGAQVWDAERLTLNLPPAQSLSLTG